MNPFAAAFGLLNTIGTAYMVGQVGWWCYKKYRELSKQEMEARQMKERFLTLFRSKFNRLPTDEEIEVALKAANVGQGMEKARHFFKSLLK